VGGVTDVDQTVAGAREAAALGLPTLPLHGLRLRGERLVCRCVRGGRCDSAGNHPARRGWPQEATTDPRGIERRQDGLRRLVCAVGRLPETLTDIRGDGCHLFYFAPLEPALRSRLDGFPGIEIKRGTGYASVTVPPSLHRLGRRRGGLGHRRRVVVMTSPDQSRSSSTLRDRASVYWLSVGCVASWDG
jgi:hypothetical protein